MNIEKAFYKLRALDELAATGTTFLHKLCPAVKLQVTLLFILAVLACNKYDLGTLLVLGFFLLLQLYLSKIPLAFLYPRLLIALPFTFFTALPNIFLDQTNVVGLTGCPLYPWVYITGGWLSFGTLQLKAMLTITAVLILIGTTNLYALMSTLDKWKIPRIFLNILLLTYHYLHLLLADALNIYNAYRLRSPQTQGIKLSHIGAILGQLLLRSIARAERIHLAMHARGYTGAIPISTPCTSWNDAATFYFCCSCLYFLLAHYANSFFSFMMK